MRIKRSQLRRIIREALAWKSSTGAWYLDYHEDHGVETYGGFESDDAARRFMNQVLANQTLNVDDSGRKPPPDRYSMPQQFGFREGALHESEAGIYGLDDDRSSWWWINVTSSQGQTMAIGPFESEDEAATSTWAEDLEADVGAGDTKTWELIKTLYGDEPEGARYVDRITDTPYDDLNTSGDDLVRRSREAGW